MMQHKKMLIFVLITIPIQAALMSTLNTLNSNFPFLDGIPITSSFVFEYKLLLYWYLPVISFSFYFSGFYRELLMTYGKVLIIRNYSKSTLIIKRFISMIGILLFFVLCQISSFYLLLSKKPIMLKETMKLFIIYYFMLLTIFSIQLFLELYMAPEIAQLIVNIYIVLSIILTKQLYLFQSPKFIFYLFLPNYGMGFKTGLSNIPEIQLNIIQYSTGLLILILLSIIILSLSIRKVRKMDIL